MDKIFKLFRTETIRNSSITTFGTFVNGALGILFYVVLARYLGPSNFGVIAVSVSIISLVADIADLGTNTGLIKFVPKYIRENRSLALRFLKLGLETKLVVWAAVLGVGYFAAPFIANLVFQKPELMFFIRLSFVGVGGAMLFSYATASLQSFQRFSTWSSINIFANFTRLILVITVAGLYVLTPASALIIYIGIPFLGFAIAQLFLPIKDIILVKDELKISNQFFSFNKWIALVVLLSAISSRLDTFIAAKFFSTKELGIYSAANQLTQIIPQFVSALGVVAAPKFASSTDIVSLLKKWQKWVIILAIGGILCIPLAYVLIPLVYGVSYMDSVLPFSILLIAQLVFLVLMPLHLSIYYYFSKPSLFVWITAGQLCVVGLGGILLIPQLSVAGLSVAVLIGMLLNMFVTVGWFLRKTRNENLG